MPHPRLGLASQLLASTIAHAAIALTIIIVAKPGLMPTHDSWLQSSREQPRIDIRHIVFIASDLPGVSGGGGGGGNRHSSPIRHAEGIGSDPITLPVQRAAVPAVVPHVPARSVVVQDVAPSPSVLLDAKPLASGNFEQIGLPTGGVSFGTSTGPGSGGGVGTGVGTGIGPGRGAGLGPGFGGGFGGGVFRPGGAVAPPRVISEVKPTYTNDALAQNIQGTVVLQFIVTREGRPSEIRVIRSLDPGGLDQQAIEAAAQWRFEPGRLAGTPVNVLVTLMLDFSIQ